VRSRARKILWSILFSGGLLGLAELGVRTWAPAEGEGLISPLAFQRQTGPISGPGATPGSRIYGGPSIVTAEQPAGLRIFFFGGSATQGYHLSRWSSFAGWYERLLREMAPDQTVEIINLGAGGEGSRQVVDVVRATAADGPADLFIVYSGNNEYYELRALKAAVPGFDARAELARRRASRFHLYRHLRDLIRPAERAVAAGELAPVDSIDVEIDADERGLGVLFYGEHLRAIAEAAQAAGVPLMLSTVADHRMSYAQPGDPPPRSPAVVAGLTALSEARGDRAAVDHALESLSGKLQSQGDHHEVGRILLHDQLPALARPYFEEAELLDPRPRRSNRLLRTALREVGEDTATPVCDAARLLDARTDIGMAGDEYFMDPCHPTPRGHRVLAEILLRCTIDAGLLPLPGTREEQSHALERILRGPAAAEDGLRLDFFMERRAQLHENRGMTDAEIRDAVWSFDDGSAPGAARAGHHAVLFHQYRAAMKWYEIALKRGGDTGPLKVSQGLVHQHLHDLDAARAALDEAVALLPEDRLVWQHRAVLGGGP
jgi:tetratricopeptide (TPR) repeat protein